jgi:hypothetical protein
MITINIYIYVFNFYKAVDTATLTKGEVQQCARLFYKLHLGCVSRT